jgi:hypothetical protein
MADEKPPEADSTFNEIIAFLGKTGAGSAKCPVCSSNSWTLPPRELGGVVELPNPIHGRSGVVVAAYLFVCNVCAYIRLHSKVKVDEAVQAAKVNLPNG